MTPHAQSVQLADVDFPLPKFRAGQTVYRASVSHETEMLPCPDCLGTRKWKVLTPAGAELSTDCIRCCSRGNIRGVPSLSWAIWMPQVRSLTIGALEICAGYGDRDAVRYMAIETGIGSGSVYQEHELHADEASARAAAAAEAEARNSTLDAKPARIEQHHFFGLQITDAAIRAASDAVYNGWRRLNFLIDDIRQQIDAADLPPADLKEEIARLIEFDREYRADRDPFDKLLAAARHAVGTADLPALADALVALPFGAPAAPTTGIAE
ncbi:hypothetical protein [Methylobacterium sp.]|uniref:hypothetical protein n=1 Tax=Methylobacterium sp. TaxID=409 RepID=UPI000F9FCEE1|nr:hypothetical protein [Methylobacterium sp.]RUP17454.1 MAG: hypothetical protein EKK44_29005 [Methylobacterium sp.]